MTEQLPTPFHAAPQHGPRPLPLFLDMLRSETAASPERFAAAMAGLAAFQRAPREPMPVAMPAVHRVGRATLRDYGGEGRPVLFVPSLINPPTILDLGEASLLRWMAGQGVHVWLIDWGEPGAADAALDLTAHVEQLLVPLIEMLDEPPMLVGYCLGGTLAIGAAAVTPVAGLATLAAPWRFSGYGEARAAMLRMWENARPACATLGLVPMEVLQAGFWRLDPGRTVSKYEAYGRMDPASAAARAFVRLEDWANAGAPLPYAAARQLFEEFVAHDRPGREDWLINGATIAPSALPCPTVEFISQADRIVPADTAAGLADQRTPGLGHVGMIISRRARGELWSALAGWINQRNVPAICVTR